MNEKPGIDVTARFSAAAVLDTWAAHDWTRGAQLESFEDLTNLEVYTLNNLYEMTVISGRTGKPSGDTPRKVTLPGVGSLMCGNHSEAMASEVASSLPSVPRMMPGLSNTVST